MKASRALGRLSGLLAGCLLLTALGGCQKPTEEPAATPTPTPAPMESEQAMVSPLCLAYDPMAGFHPYEGKNKTNLALNGLLYEGLFALDQSFQAQGVLCSGYSCSEDGKSWTFRLKETVFSDGTPLTAEQVASSLKKAKESDRYASRLADLSQITAREGEVTVKLTRANTALPVLLDVPVILERGTGSWPLGTGAYYLAMEESGELYLQGRRGQEAPMDRIQLCTVAAEEDLVSAFDTREITLVSTDLTGSNTMGYSGRYETVDYPTTQLLYVGLNTRSGACADALVRQALLRVVDRETVAGRLLASHAVATALPVHPNSELYQPELAQAVSFDPDGAQTLLEQAGWSRDDSGRLRSGRKSLSLKLVVNQDNTYKISVAEAIAEQLEELGCSVTVEKLAWDDYLNALSRGKFDLYLAETILTADFDLRSLVGSRGSLNYGGYADSQADALLSALAEAQPQQRQERAQLLYTYLAQTAPILPVAFKNGSMLTQWGRIRGAQPTQADLFAGLENWSLGNS